MFDIQFRFRHGPFDIKGGGGALDFWSESKKVFRQNGSMIFFLPGPPGRIIIFFFINEHVKRIGFHDFFIHNSDFRDNFMLNSCFCNNLLLN